MSELAQTGRHTRLLICPNAFKGSLTAAQAARALRRRWVRVF